MRWAIWEVDHGPLKQYETIEGALHDLRRVRSVFSYLIAETEAQVYVEKTFFLHDNANRKLYTLEEAEALALAEGGAGTEAPNGTQK